MTYKMYMMDFQSAHFGSGKLDTGSLTFSADRLFSALVLEAIKADKLDDFLELANRKSFVLSDAFPFKGAPFCLSQSAIQVRTSYLRIWMFRKCASRLKNQKN